MTDDPTTQEKAPHYTIRCLACKTQREGPWPLGSNPDRLYRRGVKCPKCGGCSLDVRMP